MKRFYVYFKSFVNLVNSFVIVKIKLKGEKITICFLNNFIEITN